MEGFALLVGHMVGDYIFQNDWQARWKSDPNPTHEEHAETLRANGIEREMAVLRAASRSWWRCHIAVTLHCLLYTLACFLTSSWFLPAWAYPVIFLAHWPVDRFALARRWMTNVSGQRFFASKDHPMWPNSIVLVDNTIHLVVLLVLGVVARQ